MEYFIRLLRPLQHAGILYPAGNLIATDLFHIYRATQISADRRSVGFLSAVLCSVCMLALGYIIYFIRFLFKKKQQIKGRKVRSLNKILIKISGNSFANAMQILSLALVLFAAVMCFSYFTMDGKGSGYFTDEELKGDRYYSDTGINMRDSGIDISVYVNGGVSTFGLSVV